MSTLNNLSDYKKPDIFYRYVCPIEKSHNRTYIIFKNYKISVSSKLAYSLKDRTKLYFPLLSRIITQGKLLWITTNSNIYWTSIVHFEEPLTILEHNNAYFDFISKKILLLSILDKKGFIIIRIKKRRFKLYNEGRSLICEEL
jgi:hypothetical protein